MIGIGDRTGPAEGGFSLNLRAVDRLGRFLLSYRALRHRPALAYAIAIVLTLVACVPPMMRDQTAAAFVTVFPVALLSTYLGGLGPGLVSVVLGAAGIWFLVIPERMSLKINDAYDAATLGVYVASAIATCLAVHWLIRASDSIAALARQREVFLIELQHRIKNHVQLISAILGVQARSSRDETVRQGLLDARARLNIVANAYSNLYTPGTAVTFHEHLRRLATTLRSGVAGRGAAVEVEAAEANWGPDLVVPLSLIANELIVNALEHGEPGQPIQVRLSRDDGRMSLSVSNACRLPPDFSPARSTGLGLRIVEMLSKQIKGELTIDPASGTFSVVFPEPAGPERSRS